MIFDWADYLALARQLATKWQQTARNDSPTDTLADAPSEPFGLAPTSPEAALRTAVSRAYYAAFHFARDYLDRQGRLPYSRDESHATVWRSFDRGGREAKIKSDGFYLRDARIVADYEPDLTDAAERATRSAPQTEGRMTWQDSADIAVRRAARMLSLLRDLQRKK